MKTLVLITFITLISIPKISYSQAAGYEISGNNLHYEGVIKTDSTYDAKKLYSMAIEWFATSFNNSKAVLQMQDKEAGIIVGKASITNETKGNFIISESYQKIDYTIKMYFKDGRFKYELMDFTNDGYGVIKDGEITKAPWGAKKLSSKQYSGIQKTCNLNASDIDLSLKNFFAQNSHKSNNW
jgi:hypothetical protein